MSLSDGTDVILFEAIFILRVFFGLQHFVRTRLYATAFLLVITADFGRQEISAGPGLNVRCDRVLFASGTIAGIRSAPDPPAHNPISSFANGLPNRENAVILRVYIIETRLTSRITRCLELRQ